MVNIKIITIIISVLLLLIIFYGCKDLEVERKIDANLRAELIKLKKKSELDRPITILFKVNQELTELHYNILKESNVNINANIGNIYTATVVAKSVYSVAKLKFVDYVQGQKKFELHPTDSTSVN